MACLESDFLIDFIRRKPEAISKMKELEKEGREPSATPITCTELYYGVFKSEKPNDLTKLDELFATFKILEFDLLAAKTCGELINELSRKGEKIGEKDELTAGIVLRHGENTIITRNKKHFEKIPGIKVEEW